MGTTNKSEATHSGVLYLKGQDTGLNQHLDFVLDNNQGVNLYNGESPFNNHYKGIVDITGTWDHSPWYNA